jgi:hypothetical protein
MSGGSYEYLYSKEANELVSNFETWFPFLREMTDRLKELGHPEMSEKTFKIIQNILEIKAITDSLNDRLQEMAEIWRAVEWLDSGDSDEVDKAVKNFKPYAPRS